MDYIADFKYPEIVDTLLIPRHPACNAGIDNISNLIVNWLHDRQLVVDYKTIVDIIKKIDILAGKECSYDYVITIYRKVVINFVKGELLIKLVDMSDNRTLTYKKIIR